MYYEIKTDRLVLRPLCLDDLETVHTYASDQENTLYMLWLPNDSLKETADFLQLVTREWEKDRPDYYEFAVVLDGLQIGAVSVYLDETRKTGELGWILHKKYWKKGIALEAALAVKDFAVNILKVTKVTANCDDRNVSSYRLMEKLGLALENDTGTRTYKKTSETAKELTYSLMVSEGCSTKSKGPM